MNLRIHTTEPHRRSFDLAPAVSAGDTVHDVRSDPGNPGWFGAVAPDGRRGYFPDLWFEVDPGGTTARALRDYDASELTIEAGVDVECLEVVGGWLLVRTACGEQGWVPARCCG